MKRSFVLLLLALSPIPVHGGDPSKPPIDARLGKPKDYNGYFPWTPPASKEAWHVRRQKVREQVLVANGLWPMPEKIALKPTIHGKIERDGYTIEKVFFASLPGHYVCGNLYRPTGKTGKLPAVLCPHGHWANGRLHEANDREIDNQIKQGAEQTREGAKHPLQARCAQLARMGCVVFFYDMVGYADSLQIPHRQGFLDVEAELRLQNFMGLQTFNSIRALDFLISLPDVDPARIGVTGASGGGTQTFILCGIDDRPAAAFPAVMVSTDMQGGCICENCSYLRVGTGNIELAGLFAPRPLGMSGAEDWTREIETKGLPELQALYKMLGAPDNVMAKAYRQFGHNYNQVSRELMYNFFNKHLKLGQKEPVKEQPFVPVPPNELRVFDAEHPLPGDGVDAKGVRAWWSGQSEKSLQALLPTDARSLANFRETLGTGLRVMVDADLPVGQAVGACECAPAPCRGRILSLFPLRRNRLAFGRFGLEQRAETTKRLVIWVHPEGAGSLHQGDALAPAAQMIVDRGFDIIPVEALRTGATANEKRHPVNKDFAGYTFGYNRPLLAERVHDILAAIDSAQQRGYKTIHLVGFERAGPWVILARAQAGNKVQRTAADLNQFSFAKVQSMDDEMMLPGALRYGDILTIAGLCAPGELYLHNSKGSGSARFLEAAYTAAGRQQNLRLAESKADPAAVLDWLLR